MGIDSGTEYRGDFIVEDLIERARYEVVKAREMLKVKTSQVTAEIFREKSRKMTKCN